MHINKLLLQGYVHRGLIDYVTKLLNNDNDILTKSKFGTLLSYIAACANANYVPPGFIELKSQILKRLNVQKVILFLLIIKCKLRNSFIIIFFKFK